MKDHAGPQCRIDEGVRRAVDDEGGADQAETAATARQVTPVERTRQQEQQQQQ
jgi:hypothetical protein